MAGLVQFSFKSLSESCSPSSPTSHSSTSSFQNSKSSPIDMFEPDTQKKLTARLAGEIVTEPKVQTPKNCGSDDNLHHQEFTNNTQITSSSYLRDDKFVSLVIKKKRNMKRVVKSLSPGFKKAENLLNMVPRSLFPSFISPSKSLYPYRRKSINILKRKEGSSNDTPTRECLSPSDMKPLCTSPSSSPSNFIKDELVEEFISSLNNLSFEVGFIDTHCHIDFLFNKENYLKSFKSYIKDCKYSDPFPKTYEGCVTIFCDPTSFDKVDWWKNLLNEDSVWGAFGCHPHFADKFGPVEEELLCYALQHEKVKAAGEMGLDYSPRNRILPEVQKKVFVKQLSIAQKFKKPIVIHSRDAFVDCLEIMKEMLPKNYIIHRHCFTGDLLEARQWQDHFPNLYFGFTALLTHTSRKSVKIKQVAQSIQLDRILLETDAPYFRPYYLKGKKHSHPGMAIHVAAAIAELRNIPIEKVLKATRTNAHSVYNI